MDGGIDVRLRDRRGAALEEGNVHTVADVLPWLERAIKQHNPNSAYSREYRTAAGALQIELQKIYDSEINMEISWIAGPIHVKLGNEFYGFGEESTVSSMASVLPWLQREIHRYHPESKYDVERLGGKWEPKWFGPKDYTVNGKPIQTMD
jgi:hypothetical protein